MIGRTLLHYRFLELLGSGGMGSVYLALDSRLVREVAIKVLPPRLGEGERLLREARALAAINHPNIVTIHAVEEVDGHSFLVMERIVGSGLSSRIRPGGLEAEELFAIALPLADAIAAAHARGILHRDLKPGNVMITPAGQVKVLDFGLADARPDSEAEARPKVPQVVGTVPYMAPEMIEGGTVDARSDVFSLGILLHELATGSRPFQAETLTGLMVAIVRDQRRSAPYPASLPAALAAAIDRCLAPDPADRFADAGELHLILARLAGAGREAASSASRLAFGVPRGSRAWAGRLAPWVVVAGLALMAAGWAAWSYRGPAAAAPSPAQVRKKIVVLPFEHLGPAEDVHFTSGIADEITSRLAGVAELAVISRTSALQYPPGNQPLAQIGRELGVDYALEGSVRWDTTPDGKRRVRVTPQLIQIEGDVHLWSERYDRVLDDLFAVQSEIARAVIGQLDLRLALGEPAADKLPTSNLEAWRAYLRGRELAWFISDLEQAREAEFYFERATTLDPRFVAAWIERAHAHAQVVHWGLDRSPARVAAARSAIDAALALDPHASDVRREHGFVLYWTQRDYQGALREFNAALAARPNDVFAREGRAYILRRRGRLDEAAKELRLVLELNPRDDLTWRELGVTESYLGQYGPAQRSLEQAIQLSKEPTNAYLTLARLHWRRGDLPAARRALEARPPVEQDLPHWFLFWQNVYEGRLEPALAELDQIRGPMIRWSTINTPVALLRGLVVDQLGRHAEARELFVAALALAEQRLREFPEDPVLHAQHGHILSCLGRAPEARASLDRALQRIRPADDFFAASDARYESAVALARLGEAKESLDLLEQILAGPSNVPVGLLPRDPRFTRLRDQARFTALVARQTPAAPQ